MLGIWFSIGCCIEAKKLRNTSHFDSFWVNTTTLLKQWLVHDVFMNLQTPFFLAVTALSSGPHLLLLRSFSFSSWKTGGPSCSSASELISIFCTISFSRLCCFSMDSDISFILRRFTAHGQVRCHVKLNIDENEDRLSLYSQLSKLCLLKAFLIKKKV